MPYPIDGNKNSELLKKKKKEEEEERPELVGLLVGMQQEGPHQMPSISLSMQTMS
jgi:hypothetical protein